MLVTCCAAAVGLTAQTPAPPSVAGKPLRHLEYSFTADYRFNGEGHTSGFSGGGSRSGGGGVSAHFGGRGRVGTLNVDVIGLAQDGVLAFRVNELLQNEPRPTQSIDCEVEDSGETICQDPLFPTDVEALVMVALNRSFLDDSLIDAQGKWTRAYTNKRVKVTTQYVLTNAQSAPIADITARRETQRLVGLGADWLEAETLTYDKALKVPDGIHDETDQGAKGSTQEHSVIDIHLTKDSFATPAP
jgi:hypothetical protein